MRFMEYSRNAVKDMTPRSATILLVMISLVFLGSVGFTLVKQRNVVRKEGALLAIQKAEESLKNAQDLVGLDDREAREHLNLGREELLRAERLGIPQRRASVVREGFLEVESEILKIQDIDVKEIFDFSSIGETADLVSVNFFSGEDSLLILDKENAKIWHFSNLAVSPPTIASVPLSFSGELKGLSNYEEDVLVWGERGFAMLSQNLELGETQPLSAQWEVVAVSLFSDWVYALSASQNQIFKFYFTGNGYEHTPWLGDNIEVIKTAVMAIDGDVYVWSQDLYKFRRGREQDFYLRTELDKPLKSVDAIAVWPNSTFLYLLDSQNSRVLKFDKYGRLDSQFRADELRDARDLAICKDGKNLYFVTSKQLYLGILE